MIQYTPTHQHDLTHHMFNLTLEVRHNELFIRTIHPRILANPRRQHDRFSRITRSRPSAEEV